METLLKGLCAKLGLRNNTRSARGGKSFKEWKLSDYLDFLRAKNKEIDLTPLSHFSHTFYFAWRNQLEKRDLLPPIWQVVEILDKLDELAEDFTD